MNHRHRPSRTAIAGAMAIVMLGLMLGMPLLDLGLGAGRVSVAEADAPGGWLDHDHGLCMMYGAAPWSPATRMPPPTAPAIREPAPPAETPAPAVDGHRSYHRSRAPPVA